MQKILLIDDDEFFHHIFNVIFRDKYLIYSATTADKVFEFIFNIQYDLIVVDLAINNREMGKIIVKELRKLPKYKNVPIICCSAHSSNIKKREALEAGADYYLTKPISSSELKEVLNFFLKEGRNSTKLKDFVLNYHRS